MKCTIQQVARFCATTANDGGTSADIKSSQRIKYYDVSTWPPSITADEMDEMLKPHLQESAKWLPKMALELQNYAAMSRVLQHHVLRCVKVPRASGGLSNQLRERDYYDVTKWPADLNCEDIEELLVPHMSAYHFGALQRTRTEPPFEGTTSHLEWMHFLLIRNDRIELQKTVSCFVKAPRTPGLVTTQLRMYDYSDAAKWPRDLNEDDIKELLAEKWRFNACDCWNLAALHRQGNVADLNHFLHEHVERPEVDVKEYLLRSLHLHKLPEVLPQREEYVDRLVDAVKAGSSSGSRYIISCSSMSGSGSATLLAYVALKRFSDRIENGRLIIVRRLRWSGMKSDAAEAARIAPAEDELCRLVHDHLVKLTMFRGSPFQNATEAYETWIDITNKHFKIDPNTSDMGPLIIFDASDYIEKSAPQQDTDTPQQPRLTRLEAFCLAVPPPNGIIVIGPFAEISSTPEVVASSFLRHLPALNGLLPIEPAAPRILCLICCSFRSLFSLVSTRSQYFKFPKQAKSDAAAVNKAIELLADKRSKLEGEHRVLELSAWVKKTVKKRELKNGDHVVSVLMAHLGAIPKLQIEQRKDGYYGERQTIRHLSYTWDNLPINVTHCNEDYTHLSYTFDIEIPDSEFYGSIVVSPFESEVSREALEMDMDNLPEKYWPMWLALVTSIIEKC